MAFDGVKQYDGLQIADRAIVCQMTRGCRDERAACGMPSQHELLRQPDHTSRRCRALAVNSDWSPENIDATARCIGLPQMLYGSK